ncbi:MAG: tRNA (adenosine(37)-N6)-threonylcarbamoyltransferase complex transferase subunit TsaD [Erysipelothrix sp.]|nr:tRNA (adenosine(37)-N6)-threonylcarbamoyltransferase complex transferase subunit TsaD [Erysipelothrix sp.]
MKKDLILAIETSCDETAVAILREGHELLSNIVYSQIEVHQQFGGVVPEVASRIHVEKITEVIFEALEVADVTMEDISAIGVTQGPGLIGALHVGLQAAKALAWYYEIPLIGVHHIAGHIYANELVEPLSYPLVALVVSGGHSELVLMKEENQFEVIAQTGDDAIGEAYDKVARVMDAGYPGGPVIDKMAKLGKPHYELAKVKPHQPDQFSFSGLKSSVIQAIAREEKKGLSINKEDMAFAFQERALDQILEKTKEVIEDISPKHVVIAGGVAANSRLRERIQELLSHYPEIKLTIPPMKYCTDNAAMIAVAASISWKYNKPSDLSISAQSVLDLAVF